MTLKDLPIGKTATVTTVGGEGALRQHFLDMGLIPKADVTMVKFAPMGDPVEVRIHGYELTLRLADAEKIEIDKIRDTITEPMRPQDARSVEAAETFNRQFAYARAHYFTPQREADDGEGRVR